MYKLLHEDKQYLSELKESNLVDNYLDFITLREEELQELKQDYLELYYIAEGPPELTSLMSRADELRQMMAKVKVVAQKAGRPMNAGEVKKYQQYSNFLGKTEKRMELLKKLRTPASDGGGIVGGIKKAAGDVGKAVSKAASDPTVQKAAIGIAAAAAIAAGSYAVYKRFFSQAAKACKGKPDRSACVKQFKVKGLIAAKSKLQAGMGKCKDDKCKAALKNKIAKHDVKIGKLKG